MAPFEAGCDAAVNPLTTLHKHIDVDRNSQQDKLTGRDNNGLGQSIRTKKCATESQKAFESFENQSASLEVESVAGPQQAFDFRRLDGLQWSWMQGKDSSITNTPSGQDVMGGPLVNRDSDSKAASPAAQTTNLLKKFPDAVIREVETFERSGNLLSYCDDKYEFPAAYTVLDGERCYLPRDWESSLHYVDVYTAATQYKLPCLQDLALEKLKKDLRIPNVNGGLNRINTRELGSRVDSALEQVMNELATDPKFLRITKDFTEAVSRYSMNHRKSPVVGTDALTKVKNATRNYLDQVSGYSIAKLTEKLSDIPGMDVKLREGIEYSWGRETSEDVTPYAERPAQSFRSQENPQSPYQHQPAPNESVAAAATSTKIASNAETTEGGVALPDPENKECKTLMDIIESMSGAKTAQHRNHRSMGFAEQKQEIDEVKAKFALSGASPPKANPAQDTATGAAQVARQVKSDEPSVAEEPGGQMEERRHKLGPSIKAPPPSPSFKPAAHTSSITQHSIMFRLIDRIYSVAEGEDDAGPGTHLKEEVLRRHANKILQMTDYQELLTLRARHPDFHDDVQRWLMEVAKDYERVVEDERGNWTLAYREGETVLSKL